MERRYDEEKIRLMRRERRRREIRRRQRRRAKIKRAILTGFAGILLLFIVLTIFFLKGGKKDDVPEKEGTKETVQEPSETKEKGGRLETEETAEPEEPEEEEEEPPSYSYESTESTLHLGSELNSSNAIFVDLNKRTILAGKEEMTRIVPASMTKVLTLLVAAEHLDLPNALDESYTITAEAIDYCFKNDCSCAGFEKNEVVTVRDLLHGTILPSGGEAAMGLAIYVSGSQEAFVELMNEKLQELGLSERAHFTNCVGIYEDDHYCTVYDLAVIMEAALNNDLCREVLSARTYQTSKTEQHPEGMLLSNWFLRRIEDKDTGSKVSAGKTGYVDLSGFCAVSYGTNGENGSYICVTANAAGNWKCINDHSWMYKHFYDLMETSPPVQ